MIFHLAVLGQGCLLPISIAEVEGCHFCRPQELALNAMACSLSRADKSMGAGLPLPPPVQSCAGYTVMHNIRKIVFRRLYFLKGFPNWNGISTYQLLKALCMLLSIKRKQQLIVFIPNWKKQEFLNYQDLLIYFLCHFTVNCFIGGLKCKIMAENTVHQKSSSKVH